MALERWSILHMGRSWNAELKETGVNKRTSQQCYLEFDPGKYSLLVERVRVEEWREIVGRSGGEEMREYTYVCQKVAGSEAMGLFLRIVSVTLILCCAVVILSTVVIDTVLGSWSQQSA